MADVVANLYDAKNVFVATVKFAAPNGAYADLLIVALGADKHRYFKVETPSSYREIDGVASIDNNNILYKAPDLEKTDAPDIPTPT